MAQMSTFSLIRLLSSKHSGGWYQYVPTPQEVIGILDWFFSRILHRPKSVTFTRPSGN